jgi:hypothetical protein
MIVDFDSFDSYQTANLNQKYTSAGSGCTIVPNVGVCGTQCLQVVSATHQTGAVKGIPRQGPTFQFGANVYPVGTLKTNTLLFCLYDGQLWTTAIYCDPVGSITWVTNPTASFPTTAFISNGGLIKSNEWTGVSIGGTFAQDGTGSLEIKINGISIQTANFATSGSFHSSLRINGIEMVQGTFGTTMRYDDFFVGDLTGTYNNTLLGHVHVQKMRLIGDGALLQFTPVPAGAHYLNVEDGAFPNVANGLVGNVAGTTDLYQVEQLAVVAGTEVFGVKVSSLAQKDYVGDRALQPVTWNGSLALSGLAKPIPQSNYYYVESVMEQNPSTLAAWTVADFNAQQIGIDLST